jgi:hypothetical protein
LDGFIGDLSGAGPVIVNRGIGLDLLDMLLEIHRAFLQCVNGIGHSFPARAGFFPLDRGIACRSRLFGG